MRVAIALVVLLSTACAPSEAERFTSVDLPPETSAPGSAATAPRAPRVETVQVSADVQVVVEWPATTDEDTTAMINTFRDYRAGSFRAVVTGGEDTAYYETVQEGASRDAYAWVKAFLDQRRSVRGVSRLYALNVVSVTGRGAELNACVDETGMRLLDAETGKAVRKQPDWARRPFLQVAGLRRGDDGVWRIKLLQHAKPFSDASKGCHR
ncbi:hypothetical protein [Streptosporangium sp. NPDC049304]|uniref:hypothetical protein n=1 Tax=Streptosporangium sp. NPDC049304 TaxID=3154830 RepID=UPI00342E0E6D